MKYYLRFLGIAVCCGIFCMLELAVSRDNGFEVSEIILRFAMQHVKNYRQYLPELTFWFTPLLFFQIFFGTYIYRHFSVASIYFFSRCCKRTGWFLKESLQLYLFTIFYLVIMLIAGVFVAEVFSGVIMDAKVGETLLFYLLIYSMYLFAVTLAINLAAILFGSSSGFILVESINLFMIAVYAISGDFLESAEKTVYKIYECILKTNLFSYLIYYMRENQKDYFISAFLFLAIAVLFLFCGCIVVNKCNFIESDREER
ncbi:MAG: hypothetical protein K1W19_15870 [Lachnospiraceae bacterium]|nr:hypothetical protein [Lachnospiraceae bacterium]MCI8827194.1 hypothetical protein [Lachnospiraceae bacterium]MCI9369350.1 hypothetical protein [Lachnospiraceae bacterium]